jgi:hypothetical protein
MSRSEQRTYILSGERTPEEWSSLLQELGHAGVTISLPWEAENETASTIPESLSYLTNFEQFVAPTHSIEFYSIYRSNPDMQLTKRLANFRDGSEALGDLAHSQPRGVWPRHLTDKEQQAYIRSIGLNVRYANLTGSAPAIPHADNNANHPTPVIEAGSLIDLMRGINKLPRDQLPRISYTQIDFLRSLAFHIDAAIAARD